MTTKGRTTAQLIKGLMAAAEGEHVIYVTHNQEHVQHCVNLLASFDIQPRRQCKSSAVYKVGPGDLEVIYETANIRGRRGTIIRDHYLDERSW